MTHKVFGFDWHQESLWLSPRPFVHSWLKSFGSRLCPALGLSLSLQPFYREILWPCRADGHLLDNYKWHTCSPLLCSSGTLSGPLRSFNLQIYAMMVNSSVDRSLKERLCPEPMTPAQCNLPFYTWDHWDNWTSMPREVYGYSKWVEGKAQQSKVIYYFDAAWLYSCTRACKNASFRPFKLSCCVLLHYCTSTCRSTAKNVYRHQYIIRWSSCCKKNVGKKFLIQIFSRCEAKKKRRGHFEIDRYWHLCVSSIQFTGTAG